MARRFNGGVIGRINREYSDIRKKIADQNKVSLIEADSIIAKVIKDMNGTRKTGRFEIKF